MDLKYLDTNCLDMTRCGVDTVESDFHPSSGAAMTATADRLTFRWRPTFDREFPVEVEVTDRKVSTWYVCQEQEPVSGGRVFLVAKRQDQEVDRAADVYSVFVRSGYEHCDCPGSACRRQELRCRHRLAVEYLINQGAF